MRTFGRKDPRLERGPKSSAYLLRRLSKLEVADTPVLDLPIGGGRHAIELMSRGHSVVGADIDIGPLATWRHRFNPLFVGAVRLDANQTLPFAPGRFSGAVVTDYVLDKGTLLRIAKILRPGGWLVYETYCARGGNWLTLPRVGETAEICGEDLEIVDYEEKAVGSAHATAIVHAEFRRR